MKTTGHYFKSARETRNAGINVSKARLSALPNIHISGSVAGMRKLFWGYKCDVVRVGNWIYKLN